jgi:NAD(P)-dependent dehydrogenase (short-subunit alcohol dehydrogenase family)
MRFMVILPPLVGARLRAGLGGPQTLKTYCRVVQVGAEKPVKDELFDIRGKVALVTGGTSGIGLMIARALLGRGVRCYITGRDLQQVQSIARQLGADGHCHAIAADLGRPDAAAALAADLAAREPRLHLLVNNAGANDTSPLEAVTVEAWDHVLDLNLRAGFFLVQQLLPQLRAAATPADPARVLNIGSIGGLHVPNWDAHAYGASKAALHHLTRSLAKRLGREHITVNAVAPGPFPSRLTDVTSDAVKASVAAHVPLARAGTPEDIEGVVVFLASRAGAYVSGSTIALDGGYLAAL